VWIDELVVKPDREEHIARHGISLEEVDRVVFGPSLVLRARDGRYYVIGQTESGRYLSIYVGPRGGGVFGLITAREADDAERRLYRRHRRS